MKSAILFGIIALSGMLGATRAMGQTVPPPGFDIDAAGTGEANFDTLAFNISGSNGVDPFDPTSGMQPLIYNLTQSGLTNPVTSGDILLYDPLTNALTDVLRFEQDNGDSIVAVYSDRNNQRKADVGLPSTFQTNQLILTETVLAGDTGLFNYEPTDPIGRDFPEPGYVSGGVSFYFTSAVPEPATLGMLALGTLGLLTRRPARRGATVANVLAA
ncbi:MAG: PEP-CTERM sorting domain-containing protein [Tepidisphaeraceae bacterium]|jgi:hypothetical protein